MGITKRVPKVGKISAKNDILTVQEKQISHEGNITKIILERTLQKTELEARYLKSVKMWINKQIEKDKMIFKYI